MDISCAFAPVSATPEHIQLAEGLGYRRAWVFDTPALQLDVWATLALAAVRTKRIELGPGVLIPSLRHVVVTASAVATLVGLAPGRVNVGLGTGFSGRFTMGKKPNRWDFVADYARQLKALLAGETAEVDGAMTRMLHGPGQAPPRPIRVPILFATAGPRGEAIARELGDGVFTVIPIGGFSWESLLTQGTVLEPGEDFGSPRARAAAGAGASVVFHRAWDRPAPGRPKLAELDGGLEWRARIEAIDPAVRHLHTHEGHLTFVNEIDEKVINGALIRDLTFTGEADVLRERLEDRACRGVTEIAYQPAGPDIPRELRAFAQMAGISR
ncbi:MAG: LLM class flavin-dependent oxidoreductase [Gammaproteobacteria bacterium]|nr:MAG: LLM class flavin-dependent oxidoreductase [Gammaproteobacteria bacterium]